MKFRKKPVVIEAEQFDPNKQPWPAGVTRDSRDGHVMDFSVSPYYIDTLEGRALNVKPGDWIITGVKGEKYPCRDDIFKETYEPVD